MDLQVLHNEWNDCSKCAIATRRKNLRYDVVQGMGSPGGILFIGDKPLEEDEENGMPFSGTIGETLQEILNTLKMHTLPIFYTNMIGCRNCVQNTSADGSLQFRTRNGRKEPVWRDEAPIKSQVEACAPRVYEEIYQVDPIVIVAFGSVAAEFMIGNTVHITKDHGQLYTAEIPGKGYVPSITEKKKEWVRGYVKDPETGKRKWNAPVLQNNVQYLCIPTYHPSYVYANMHNAKRDNPLDAFAADLKKAAKIYVRYVQETEGYSVVG